MNIPHEMLVANAGSGKTYRLTTRMITLLGLGIEPRKIAALTFTKKAAGEFLDAVFERLAGAATNSAALEKLRADTGLHNLRREDCLQILRNLVRQLGGLSMGTIDSLFAKIARAFPFECGLAGEFTILPAQGIDSAREEALAGLFESLASNTNSLQVFVGLLRKLSRNRSERNVFETVHRDVENFHHLFLETPREVEWGDPSRIWSESPSPVLTACSPRQAADAMAATLASTHPSLDLEAEAHWLNGLEIVRDWDGKLPMPEPVGTFLEKTLCKKVSTDADGNDYLPIGRKTNARVYLVPEITRALTNLKRALKKSALDALLEESRSLHNVLRLYEQVYHRKTRTRGLLTFADVTSLVAGLVQGDGWISSAGYRLDNRHDHWLLDEFQDTSRTQWEVLRAFIDEVLQDATGTRSLFYVGDTKQAIYSWRGGDPKLFFEIHGHYKGIREEALERSFRSTPEIVETVNTIFGSIADHAAEMAYPAKTVSDWTRGWKTHTTSERTASLEGYVQWTAVDPGASPKADDEDEDDGESPADPQDLAIADLLENIRPWQRGWSCAALKVTNKQVNALAALLQHRGIPVAAEGTANPCVDNPLGAALMAAFRCVVCPSDSLAEIQLAGSPLGHLLANGDFRFREESLRRISTAGFAGTIRDWLSQTDLSNESFLQTRAADFLEAAAAFDASRTAADGILKFLDFLRGHGVQEAESRGVVRIMTVHQAKGLTFDMAVVSNLDSRTGGSATRSLVLGPDKRSVEWGLLLPDIKLCEIDCKLKTARENYSAEEAYSALCAQYVALTRPRFGLYIFTKALKPGTRSKNFARLLMETLPENFQRGNPAWFERKPLMDEASSTESSTQIPLNPPLHATPRPVTPSSASPAEEPTPGESQHKEPPAEIPAALGSEIHELLAGVEWLTSIPVFPNASPAARSLLKEFFASPHHLAIFQNPSPSTLLWREKSFDVLVENEWVSGAFDRVHIETDSSGKPLSVKIIDFKTTHSPVATLTARYKAQMDLYQQAAAALLNLPKTSIPIQLVAIPGSPSPESE